MFTVSIPYRGSPEKGKKKAFTDSVDIKRPQGFFTLIFVLFISESQTRSAVELVEQVRVPPLRGIPSISHPFGENSNTPYSGVKTSITWIRSVSDIDSSATASTKLET